VIEPGEIAAGDRIEVVHRPDHDVTIATTFRALTTEPELIGGLLAADAHPHHIRDRITARLRRP
jgi:MOSC domain-containing protein YiiM